LALCTVFQWIIQLCSDIYLIILAEQEDFWFCSRPSAFCKQQTTFLRSKHIIIYAVAHQQELTKCSKYGSWLGVITSLGIIVSNRYPMLLHVRSECVISECWTGWCRSLSRSRLLDISREHKGKVEYISNRRVDGTCACFRVPWLCGFVVAHGVGSGSGCSDASG
jgi:hypothetical protein